MEHFTITIFIVISVVMWDITRQKARDVLDITCHYLILTVCLVQDLMMD